MVRIRNRHSDLCLDNCNFGTDLRVEARQWTCNGDNVQRWTLS